MMRLLKYIFLLIICYLFSYILTNFLTGTSNSQELATFSLKVFSKSGSTIQFSTAEESSTCNIKALEFEEGGKKIQFGEICWLPISLPKIKTYAPIFSLSEEVLRGKICIESDLPISLRVEVEKANGESLYDIRKFGKLIDNNRCLEINTELPEKVEIPVDLHQSLKSLLNLKVGERYLVNINYYLVSGLKGFIVINLITFIFITTLFSNLFSIWDFTKKK